MLGALSDEICGEPLLLVVVTNSCCDTFSIKIPMKYVTEDVDLFQSGDGYHDYASMHAAWKRNSGVSSFILHCLIDVQSDAYKTKVKPGKNHYVMHACGMKGIVRVIGYGSLRLTRSRGQNIKHVVFYDMDVCSIEEVTRKPKTKKRKAIPISKEDVATKPEYKE